MGIYLPKRIDSPYIWEISKIHFKGHGLYLCLSLYLYILLHWASATGKCGWLTNNRNLFFGVLEAKESRRKELENSVCGWELTSWFMGCYVFSVTHHGRGTRVHSGVSLYKASLVAHLVKNLPAMQETWVQSLSWEDPLEKGKAIHFTILAWRIHGLCSPWGHKESDTTEWLSLHFTSGSGG